MTQEEQLILLLARGTMSHLVREQALALLATPLRWELILEQTINEKIYPLVNRNLSKLESTEHGAGSWEQGTSGKEQTAESNGQGAEGRNQKSESCGQRSEAADYCSARERLVKLEKINSFRNALLAEELGRVLNLLAEAGIPTIPLKGVSLAESLYGNVAARVCSDIDLLVPRRNVREAFRILYTAGFEAHDQTVESSEIDRLLESNIEYSFLRRSEGVTVLLELHWDIAWRWGKGSIVIDDLWAEAQPRQYWGIEGYGLSPEWELLYLAVHAAHHRWQGLKWLVDIHEMGANPEIDWDKLGLKAKRLELKRMLALTLSASHKLFGTEIPADLLITPLPKWMKVFPDKATPTDVWKNNFFPARLFKQPSEKIAYLARVALVPTLNEQRLISLPSFLSFLYYLLRPLRLSCKWASSFARAGYSRVSGVS